MHQAITRTRNGLLLLAFCAAAAMAIQANAALITWNYTGTVTEVRKYGWGDPGDFAEGVAFTGTLTFNDDALPYYEDSTIRSYVNPSIQVAFSTTAGATTFFSSGASFSYLWVADDAELGGVQTLDAIGFTSRDNSMLLTELNFQRIGIGSQSAITTLSLPPAVPDPSLFDANTADLVIYLPNPSGADYQTYILCQITSMSLAPTAVPDGGSTAGAFGLCLLLGGLWRRRTPSPRVG